MGQQQHRDREKVSNLVFYDQSTITVISRRERERETERETETERQTERDRERERQTDIQTDRDRQSKMPTQA